MTIRLMITSPVDREKVVVELWHDEKQIAEVSNESSEFRIEFYSPIVQDGLSFKLDDFFKALEKAKSNLAT